MQITISHTRGVYIIKVNALPVVTFTAGFCEPDDIRAIAKKLAERLGVTDVIDNLPRLKK